MQANGGTLTVWANEVTRSLTSADRLRLDGEEYEIEMTPQEMGGNIRIEIAQAPTPAVYAREMEQRGEMVVLQRPVANAQPINAPARAIITGYSPEEIVSGIEVGERKLIMLASDLRADGFPLPPRRTDRILQRGRVLTILDVDDSTHRSAGTLNAYQMRVAGAA